MKPRPLLYLIHFIVLFGVCFKQLNGQSNPCGVVAGIYPAAQDSVVPPNTVINFINTSTNATSVQWLYDGFPWVGGNSLNVSIPPGIVRISLVAYNGNCTDTITVVYFSAGTPHNIDTILLAHYGTSRYNEQAEFIEKTVDSGFLVIGTQYKWDPCGEIGVLVKLRDKGCIDWSKKLLQPYYCPSTRITAFHLNSDTNYYAVISSFELVKLNRYGDLVWAKKYYSNGWPLYFQHITGDNQGNVYLTSYGIQMNAWTITKIDKNGNVIWNKIFRLSHQMPGDGSGGPPYEYASATGITFLNGKIYVSVNAYTNTLSNFTSINRIDPATGSMGWKYGYTDAVVGALGISYLGLYDTLLMASSAGQGQAVTFIDQQGNVRKSISAKFATSYGAKKTKAVANRNGRIYMMQWTEQTLPLQPGFQYHNNFAEIDTSMNKYGGLVFEEYSRPWFSDIAVGLDDKPGAVGTHWGLVNDTWASRDIRYLKIDSMINTDLYCYAYDNNYSVFQNQVSRFNFNYLVDSSAIAAEGLHSEISVVDAWVSSRYNCPDFLDSCSLLKLSGPRSLCSFSNTYTYKIHRNRACVIVPQFQLPPGVIIMNQTDSTISLKFPAFGSYTVSAWLNTCIPVKDSLTVNIVSRSYPLNLGYDTTICAGTTIKLHAGNHFLTYLWNDGSTDSILNITQPGLYWVETIDSCNNLLRDSINITSFYLPISIGPDRTKCNNDTLHLNGPPGFISYEWSNNYNISSTNSQNTIVNPMVDTSYYLKAEKLPGCFSYDTVRVTVLHSPSIYLGADTSLCRGDSLLLNAGVGFSQYQWNNGANSQQLFVNTTGAYSVIATTQQGCKSFDTLQIINLFALPVVSLDSDTTLCTGDTRVLNAGAGFSSYAWNTGSNSPTISVNGPGQYIVSVIDNNGCKGSDTTNILRMLPKPSGFLGPDTAICSYGDLQLRSISGFNQYTWSTGAASSSIVIKQPGNYWLQVRDANGCTGKDTIIVNLKQCLQGFFMPTAFTPNNDGKNDLLKPLLFGDVVKYRFWIYNRWGELVFESTDVTKGWNGTYKAQPQNPGVFVWVCEYQFEGEIVKYDKGTLVLIR